MSYSRFSKTKKKDNDLDGKKLKAYRKIYANRENQATKSIRRMPWYMAPKKDVTSCEKLR